MHVLKSCSFKNQDFVHFSNWLENYHQVKNQPKMSHMIFVTKMDFWRENSNIFTLKVNKSRHLKGFHVNSRDHVIKP